MQVKTFRELVNDAILETKVTLDPLTDANFASPPRTLLYTNFKKWVNTAYKELMIDHPEWFFRKERALVELKPRLHLSGLSYIPSVGDELSGVESEVKFKVLAVYNFEDNELDPTIERTVDIEWLDDTNPAQMIPLEQLNVTSPTPATNVGFVKGIGRYDFSEVVGLDEIDPDNIKAFYNNSYVGVKLEWVNYTDWVSRWNYYPYSSGAHPDFITRAPDGGYEFFPQPTVPFVLEFDYTRKFEDLVDSTDVPVGLDPKYQDILVWKAVAEYADFDNNAKVYARAAKKMEKYNYYLMRDEMPRISIGRTKFMVR